jgi:hypothetical protein
MYVGDTKTRYSLSCMPLSKPVTIRAKVLVTFSAATLSLWVLPVGYPQPVGRKHEKAKPP